MSRWGYVGRRLIQLVIVVVGITILVFFMIHMTPGDPARIYLGAKATPENVARLHHQWGLDQPLAAQYELFMSRLAHGNLGTSLLYQTPTSQLILGRLPATLGLVAYSAVLLVLITIPLATLSATKRDSVRDHVIRVASLGGLGMPPFWVGIILILVLGLGLRAFPVGGYGDGFLGHLWSLFLPALTIAISVSPILIRSLRASMIEILDSEFVVTAQAKGVARWRLTSRHILPNAIIPTITLLGVNISFLVGGTVVIEQVFGLPGIGKLMIDAILARDFPTVQGVTLVFAVLVVLVNLLTDVGYSLLDPRVRFD